MTNFDDRIAEALRDVPTAAQRPLADIEARGRTRKRRRTFTAAAGVLSGVALAVPAIASLDHSSGTTADSTATNAETRPCTEAFSSVEDVPEEMRVLWDTSEFLEPSEASLVDPADLRGCQGWAISEVMPAGFVEVLDEADGTARGIRVTLQSETLTDVRSTTLDSSVGSITVHRAGQSHVSASWPAADGELYWQVSVLGHMPDSELVELAEAARLDEGAVDLSQWSGLDEAAKVRSGGPGEAPPGWGWSNVHRYQVGTGNLSLTVEPGHDETSLWSSQILPGSDVSDVTINGNPGFLAGDDTLRWLTDDGLLFSISSTASYSPDRLIELAESVAPVPADDPRLQAIWQTGVDQPAD